MRLLQSFVCLLLLGTLLAPARLSTLQAQTSQPRQVRDGFIGMVVRDPYYEWGSDPAAPNAPNRMFQDQMGKLLARSGVAWVRFEIHIGSDVAGDLAKHDYFINTVAPRYGLKVLALLSFDLLRGRNLWDLNCQEKTCAVNGSKYGGGVNEYMQQWLDRALVVSDHYGRNIAAYEILNEQNRLAPNGFGIKPTIVGRLTTKFYRFCHGLGVPNGETHACSNAQIILGGLHPLGTSDEQDPKKIAMTDVDYLSQIYDDAESFAGFVTSYQRYPVDGIGYHPYPEEIRQSLPRQVEVDTGLDRIQAVVEARDPGRQLWITEIGYNVAYYRNTPAALGPFVRDVYTTLATRTLKREGYTSQPAIANVFWFKYEDFAPAEGRNAQQWGMVHIPFSTDSSRPDGVRYQTDGVPTAIRDTHTVLRELAGVPPDPVRAFVPLVGR